MNDLITVTYPNDLASVLNLPEKELQDEIKKLTVVKLYELGKISSGIASKILNISRVDFLQMLSKYQVSFFQYNSGEELLKDLENA